jgi:hypothetical protein
MKFNKQQKQFSENTPKGRGTQTTVNTKILVKSLQRMINTSSARGRESANTTLPVTAGKSNGF